MAAAETAVATVVAAMIAAPAMVAVAFCDGGGGGIQKSKVTGMRDF